MKDVCLWCNPVGSRDILPGGYILTLTLTSKFISLVPLEIFSVFTGILNIADKTFISCTQERTISKDLFELGFVKIHQISKGHVPGLQGG